MDPVENELLNALIKGQHYSQTDMIKQLIAEYKETIQKLCRLLFIRVQDPLFNVNNIIMFCLDIMNICNLINNLTNTMGPSVSFGSRKLRRTSKLKNKKLKPKKNKKNIRKT